MNITCKECGFVGDETYFYKHEFTRTGYTTKCKNCFKSYYKQNREVRLEASHQRHKRLPDYQKEYQKQRYTDNPDLCSTYYKAYYKKNKDKYCLNAKRYASRVKQATPPWLTEEHWEQIIEFYKLAKELEYKTGIPHHVDHIIPLKGKDVCGLHVPWNLQVIPAKENLKKSNKLGI